MHCRELSQKATKETEAVVDLKKPSFSSVEFLVRLLSLRRNQFLQKATKETEVSVDGRPKPSFSVKERGSNGAFTLFAIFCLKFSVVKQNRCRKKGPACAGPIFFGLLFA
jgi:hypothetical protein